jgi:chaperone required for assembly of F1-ATPase
MSNWKPKRFWETASVTPVDGGWTVMLDGRAVRTPAKAPLVLPTAALAELVASEWDAQQGEVRPETMPATRMANSAIDKVQPQFAEVAEMLAEYAGTDLLCYRAEEPEPLAARQAERWNPLLAWAEAHYGAPLLVTRGIVHVPQPAGSLQELRAAILAQGPHQLAALHDLIAITGSLVLGLAIAEGRITADDGFDLSRIDEHWQIEQWGQDEEAAEIEAAKHRALIEAARFHKLCR